MSTKQCALCAQHKQLSDYYKAAGKSGDKDGYNRYCIQCCKVNRSLEGVRKRDRASKISFRQRHRATGLGVECDSTITLAGVFKARLGICGLCGTWVQPGHASMDHIHPLSLGGTHTWENIQLVHLTCNLRKGAKIDYQHKSGRSK